MGDSRLPISFKVRARTNGYRRTVEPMRFTLCHCCKYTAKQGKLVTLQLLRRGRVTHLWKNGATKEVRVAMGCWETPEVEPEVLEIELEEPLKFNGKLRSSVATFSMGWFGLGGGR